jgi:signal transduction histidine kinase
MTFRKTLAATASSFAIALAAAPVLVMTAQTASAQAEGAQTEAAPVEGAETELAYSATELDAFVAAFLEVSELRTEYTQRLQQASDETEQQTIVEEGNAAIVEAIDGVEGMDVELYSAILDEAGTNTALNDQVTQRLQAASEG